MVSIYKVFLHEASVRILPMPGQRATHVREMQCSTYELDNWLLSINSYG